MLSEEDIDNFIQGKECGFSRVYDEYSRGMYSVCFRYLQSTKDAEDALQESFIKIFNSRESFDKNKNIGAWIKTITIRTTLDLIKKKQYFRDFIKNQPSDPFIFDNEEERHTHLNFQENLKQILNEIPKGYSTIFQLYVIENLSHEEIANYLGISIGTSKSQLSHAKKMIRSKLTRLKIAL